MWRRKLLKAVLIVIFMVWAVVILTTNQNHPLNGWFAPALKGPNTSRVSRRIEKGLLSHNLPDSL